MSVLHRNWHNGSYPVIATGVFCDNAPDFQDWPDWPNATHTDERCRQRCLANSPSALSASAQMSDDGNTVVVRLANTARTPTTVIVEVARGSRKDTVSHATLWMLSSPSGNMLDANTPAEPTRVEPRQKHSPGERKHHATGLVSCGSRDGVYGRSVSVVSNLEQRAHSRPSDLSLCLNYSHRVNVLL